MGGVERVRVCMCLSVQQREKERRERGREALHQAACSSSSSSRLRLPLFLFHHRQSSVPPLQEAGQGKQGKTCSSETWGFLRKDYFCGRSSRRDCCCLVCAHSPLDCLWELHPHPAVSVAMGLHGGTAVSRGSLKKAPALLLWRLGLLCFSVWALDAENAEETKPLYIWKTGNLPPSFHHLQHYSMNETLSSKHTLSIWRWHNAVCGHSTLGERVSTDCHALRTTNMHQLLSNPFLGHESDCGKFFSHPPFRRVVTIDAWQLSCNRPYLLQSLKGTSLHPQLVLAVFP